MTANTITKEQIQHLLRWATQGFSEEQLVQVQRNLANAAFDPSLSLSHDEQDSLVRAASVIRNIRIEQGE